MILTNTGLDDIQVALQADFIADKSSLADYQRGGFAPDSDFNGQARQTFSLLLQAKDYDYLYDAMSGVYQQLLQDIGYDSGSQSLPFDYLRCDAFYDPAKPDLQLLEINTRNVAMHEITEWLDDQVATVARGHKAFSLNTAIVRNQHRLHQEALGDFTGLLYIDNSDSHWLYAQALHLAYGRELVHRLNSTADIHVSSQGVQVGSKLFRAITKKLVPLGKAISELDVRGVVKVVQPRHMRPFGRKDYLPHLPQAHIAQTKPFDPDKLAEYVARQGQLVLKRIELGAAKGIYLGGRCSARQWQQKLQQASVKPHLWIMQTFIKPPVLNILPHGMPPCPARVQLSIFMLPDPDQPTKPKLDFYARAYVGGDEFFLFDPASHQNDIWFGNVIIAKSAV